MQHVYLQQYFILQDEGEQLKAQIWCECLSRDTWNEPISEDYFTSYEHTLFFKLLKLISVSLSQFTLWLYKKKSKSCLNNNLSFFLFYNEKNWNQTTNVCRRKWASSSWHWRDVFARRNDEVERGQRLVRTYRQVEYWASAAVCGHQSYSGLVIYLYSERFCSIC